MDTNCDVIVVGGGPAGASAAIALARQGWHVVIVEKSRFPRQKVCGEFISATTWPLLREMGIGDLLASSSGPPVRQVGVFVEHAQLTAPMPVPAGSMNAGGCAIGRDALDAALLERAKALGADVRQPARVVAFADSGDDYACTVEDCYSGLRYSVRAPLVIAAHGSWETGPLPTQSSGTAPKPSDLLAFKARFRNSSLPSGLMPLLAFPGGYGGMVHTDGAMVSLSCCIRRDVLARCRSNAPGRRAGDAVLAHIARHCNSVATALRGATVESAWLAAGPIRTGLRSFGHGGVFAVGNAAAEAHPIVAEGISMAIQSAALLCARLLMHPRPLVSPFPARRLAAIRNDYAGAWRRNFAVRLHASALFAQLFMRPATARAAVALIRRYPSLVTLGSRWSGKAAALQTRQSNGEPA